MQSDPARPLLGDDAGTELGSISDASASTSGSWTRRTANGRTARGISHLSSPPAPPAMPTISMVSERSDDVAPTDKAFIAPRARASIQILIIEADRPLR